MKHLRKVLSALLVGLLSINIIGCTNTQVESTYEQNTENKVDVETTEEIVEITKDVIDEYIRQQFNVTSDEGLYYIINNNIPELSAQDSEIGNFENYSELDELGRCGEAYANICQEIMPTEERGEIGHIKPTGWHTVKYDNVDGKYLYNRCHLIGFQLAGENDNELNLITGTRAFNVEAMLPFENMIADYVKETSNHVLYKVTPVYEENNLVAYGVLMEALSVEDEGAGIMFSIFAKNIQDGIQIDYKTGESHLVGEELDVIEEIKTYTENSDEITYILNIESKKYHLDTCRYAESMSEENKETFNGTKEWLADNGYEPCGVCKP